MNTQQLEDYLHEQIPASKLPGVGVTACSEHEVILTAPLQPNINHKNTVFGGSLSMLAILSGWSLVFMRLAGIRNEIVIQHSDSSYLSAATADVSAISRFEESSRWSRFDRGFNKKGKGRIQVCSDIICNGQPVAVHHGTYVAINNEYHEA